MPRLNCDPVAAITVSKPLFEASPACKAFTIETPDGKVFTIADLEHVEWTPPEDLAEEPEPDRLDELENQINELMEEKVLILDRLEDPEKTVKALGKRKAPTVLADDDDDEPLPTPHTAGAEPPSTPHTAGTSRTRRSK